MGAERTPFAMPLEASDHHSDLQAFKPCREYGRGVRTLVAPWWRERESPRLARAS